ncbi:PLP-dependent transferase [Ascobolus immersus RN42]|uniref:PLP-dependent transferase n=1 Tax=Ascobolus immersus RN42 TaxID=1160509 RepID=A0A3N4IBJ6_ASCIM|nr:PLP-dependent transferase [Ascobolus immersus RN42]
MATSRADELKDLLAAVEALILPVVQSGDLAHDSLQAGSLSTVPQILDYKPPSELKTLIGLNLGEDGSGKDGLLELIQRVLKYSVNTWHPGFMDKLYASTNPVGVISDLILSILNTNLHVYTVSPALSTIERLTAQTLAARFSLTSPFSGGTTQPGGSAANLTSLIVARNTLIPTSKTAGTSSLHPIIFTSSASHYSILKAAMIMGLGTSSVRNIPTDSSGAMIISELEAAILASKAAGELPFYVNATAGTTVHGAFDPFTAIGQLCKEHGLWFHIDGSWGGPFIFSPTHKAKLAGCELADSITVNPHKMLSVPVTCSFLLGADMRKFQAANSLAAGYLFHDSPDRNGDDTTWDLGDLTLQCGRRGDAFKFALSWVYYGASTYAKWIDDAAAVANLMAGLIKESSDFELVGGYPVPCLQVCFYYKGDKGLSEDKEVNTRTTARIVQRLVGEGFMVDYAPGEKGHFFRVVVNVQTKREVVVELLGAVRRCAGELGV